MDCIFCKIAKDEIKSNKIYENANFFSINDSNPITKGHCLVISKKHFETILDLPKNLGEELIDCINKTASKIIKETSSSGFNVINNNFESSGQIIPHIHFHIIPRKKGDNIKIC
jgi:histidine triad (HIT) family protein